MHPAELNSQSIIQIDSQIAFTQPKFKPEIAPSSPSLQSFSAHPSKIVVVVDAKTLLSTIMRSNVVVVVAAFTIFVCPRRGSADVAKSHASAVSYPNKRFRVV